MLSNSKYDVAGRQVSYLQARRVFTRNYDGDGGIIKSSEVSARCNIREISYYLHSSVLGGQVVTILGRYGARLGTNFYANGELIAFNNDAGALDPNGFTYWKHENPITRSSAITDKTGAMLGGVIELDPLGAQVDPPAYDPNADCDVEPSPVYLRRGDPSDLAAGCTWDGAATPCSLVAKFLGNGSAVACPDNLCGPRVLKTTLSIGGSTVTERELTSPFMAYQNGAAGFWVGAVGSPDEYVPTIGGDTWTSKSGGTLVAPGYGYSVSGRDAVRVGVLRYARLFLQGNQRRGRRPRREVGNSEMEDRLRRIQEEELQDRGDLPRQPPPKEAQVIPTPDKVPARRKIPAWERCQKPFLDALNQFAADLNEDKFLESLGKAANAHVLELSVSRGNPSDAFKSSAKDFLDGMFEKVVALRRAGIVAEREVNKACGPKPDF
jgi:hypothetical protein